MSVQLATPQPRGLVRPGRRAGSSRRLAATVLAAGTLAAIVAPGASAKTVSLTCHGGSSSCSATIGLAGGASNKKLKIALSDTNLKLVAITAKPSEV
jgi:hypothetical protein